MTTLLNKIEKEFDERFSLDWCKGFGTTDDIDKLGLSEIKYFFRQSLISLLEENCERLEKSIKICSHDSHSHCMEENCFIYEDGGYNQALNEEIAYYKVKIEELKR